MDLKALALEEGNIKIYDNINIPNNITLICRVIYKNTFYKLTYSRYNLQELFKELKEKEGIASIDDILRQVVKPDGMSFNGIQPVYRELLLKLAMSMSRDEMFIRSQNIMNEEKGQYKQNLILLCILL